MLRVVGIVYEINKHFAIYDTDDEDMDLVHRLDLEDALRNGVEILGASLSNNKLKVSIVGINDSRKAAVRRTFLEGDNHLSDKYNTYFLDDDGIFCLKTASGGTPDGNHIVDIPNFVGYIDQGALSYIYNGNIKVIGGKGLYTFDSMFKECSFRHIDLTAINTKNIKDMSLCLADLNV